MFLWRVTQMFPLEWNVCKISRLFGSIFSLFNRMCSPKQCQYRFSPPCRQIEKLKIMWKGLLRTVLFVDVLVAWQRGVKERKSESQARVEARAVRAWELTPTPILRNTPGFWEFGKYKKKLLFCSLFCIGKWCLHQARGTREPGRGTYLET